MNNLNITTDIILETIKPHLFSSKFDISDDLLEIGAIDSFGYIEMLTSLEKKFQIEIFEHEYFDPKLRSITGIISFIRDKVPS